MPSIEDVLADGCLIALADCTFFPYVAVMLFGVMLTQCVCANAVNRCSTSFKCIQVCLDNSDWLGVAKVLKLKRIPSY